ncbi:MAG: hypothetical protein FJ117_24120 [Deltaproteobacteria bacterium]|nr:hypothetical protein [Deltaproteobacteria bacterium]
MSGTASKGGYKYCPRCQRVVETRVMEEFNDNVDIGGLQAKRRKIKCGLDRAGAAGCRHEWFTVEVIESELKAQLGLTEKGVSPGI